MRILGRVAASTGVAALAVTLLVLVPASVGETWSGVLDAFDGLPALTVGVLGILWLAGLTGNSFALAASLPGLTLRRALTLSLSGSALANLLPLGGAAGITLNYAMTRSWGFNRKSFAAYTVTTNVVDVGLKLLVVGAASATLLVEGQVAALPLAVRTSLRLLLVLPALGLLLVHRPNAARVGRLLDRLGAAGGRILRRPLTSHFEASLPQLSAATTSTIRRRWRPLTFGSLGYACLQTALLWACLHVSGLDLDTSTLAAALIADRLLTTVTLTPGGLGVVEGGMVATLVALGAPAGPAVVGVVLYRCFTYLAEIPVGGLLIAGWLLRRQTAVLATTPGGFGPR